MSHLEHLERKILAMNESRVCHSGEGSICGVSLNSTSSYGGESTDPFAPKRFYRVPGYDCRINDLIYCRPLNPHSEDEEISVDTDHIPSLHENRQKCVVFFGGDMQDFPEIMEQHKDNMHLSTWNLDRTAVILQKQFPNHHIVVVRPVRYQIMAFSCFDNFVNSTSSTGIPDHVITHGSLQHLQLILRNLSLRIEKQNAQSKVDLQFDEAANAKSDGSETEVSSTTTEESFLANGRTKDDSVQANPQLDKSRISLVGFSKGCVVLNQLLYEFHFLKTLTPDDSSMDPFVSCIEEMYWLDGGHNGGKNTWITSRSLLETFSRTGIRVYVHVTPFQLNDERRPWLKKEERQFSEWLKKFGVVFKRYLHFENEHNNIHHHFKLLSEFTNADKFAEGECSPEGAHNNTQSSATDVLSM